MKIYMLKTFLLTCVMLSGISIMQAQFDDVYYDPDNLDPEIDYSLEPSSTKEYTYEDEVTYYDDDEYEYYDDYDYYYTSRVNRFHRSYSGFDFYDPIYVSYNYYDPFHGDSYYYPGSSIYISFGNNSYWDYRHWRNYNRWNRWNNYSQWNNWCVTPSSYYYSYNNNWYGSGYNYWGGNHGYHSYSNYYNNYYNTCPYPVSYYNGITNTTVHNVNSGGTRGTYYGPRITGNTGSSPRGPVTNPGAIQPVYKDRDNNVTDTNDRPDGLPEGVKPGRVTPNDPNNNPVPVDRQNNNTNDNTGGVRQVPVDKEVKRDEPVTPRQRPIFRPDSDKYQPYPNDKPKTTPEKPVYTPENRPSTTPRENYTPRPTDQRPSYTPPRESEKPSYTPPPRSNNEKPSYTPRPSNNNDRPSYTPPKREESPKSNDRPSYTPPPKREERPSYTPPPRNDSTRSSEKSSYSPSPSRDNNSSSSGSRSSGGSGGSNNSSSSPRGRG